MNICELLPGGKPKHPAGASEPSTSFLDSFLGLRWPRARTIQGVTLQKKIDFGVAFQPNRLNTQKEEVDGVPCDKAQVSNHQSTIYKGPLNNHTVSKHQPHRSSSERSQKGSASDLLRTLDHQNIDTIWFLDEEVGPGYQVTFSSSVTLYTLTQGGCRLSVERAECYFKQAVRGVEYLHSTGIAHRDINPENLLVAVDGTIKITDFSHAGRFWASGGEMSKIRLSSNRCGSPSYLAPEVFVERHFDPRPVDMWALAIVYMEMRTGRLLWTFAAEGGDEYYDKYLQDRSGLLGYRPVENLENESSRKIIRSLLEPMPQKRSSASQVLRSFWLTRIEIGAGGRVNR